jgi:sigma-B regulation protein RsbU (phosphoserine phosphatase)
MTAAPSSILIADDEELNREGLARRLQRHGYETTLAENGLRAIELLGERQFDLLLLDVMMPEMNGLEVLKFVRRVDSLLDLPIIMVTARGESEDVVEALELGASDYVTKPINFPVVLARVRSQLALRRAVTRVTDLERQLNARNKELEGTAGALSATNELMTRDLDDAGRVQAAFRPESPLEVPGGRAAWAVRPAGKLSGVSVSAFRLGDGHLGVFALDAGRHGAAAALLTTTAGHLLTASAAGPAPPAEVLGRMAKRFPRTVTGGTPLALLYGVLDLEGGEFRFASAGHPGPVHLPAGGTPTQLEGAGLPLGVGAGGYKEQTVRLRPGDRLVLYTDGLTGARNADGEHFGAHRLLETLGSTAPADGLAELVRRVEQWHGDGPARRDVAALSLERTDPTTAGQ